MYLEPDAETNKDILVKDLHLKDPVPYIYKNSEVVARRFRRRSFQAEDNSTRVVGGGRSFRSSR